MEVNSLRIFVGGQVHSWGVQSSPDPKNQSAEVRSTIVTSDPDDVTLYHMLVQMFNINYRATTVGLVGSPMFDITTTYGNLESDI